MEAVSESKPLTDRPKDFDSYIGNERAKNILKEAIQAHEIEFTCLPHILIYGSPGMGKTTVANIIATEAKYKIITTIGSAIRFQADILKIIMEIDYNSSCGWKTILFIDEIHNLDKQSLPETLWYPFLEDFIFYSNMEGKPFDFDGIHYKATGNSHVLDQPFCCIGSTTNPEMLTAAMRRRFGIQLFLEDYTIEDLSKIVRMYGLRKYNIFFTSMACQAIASRARFSPATAISIADAAIRRHIVINNASLQECLNKRIALRTLRPLFEDIGIMDGGFKREDVAVLSALEAHPKGLGKSNLAKVCGFTTGFYEELIEGFLKKLGLIVTSHRTFITPKGTAFLQKYHK